MSKETHTDSEAQGLVRLLAEAIIGVTDLVETMHRSVVHPPFLPSTPIQHLITNLAGLSYKSIRWGTQLVSMGLDKLMGQLEPFLGTPEPTEEREIMRAVLNGVVGDYLEEKDNPLQIDMKFRYQGKELLLNKTSLEATYPTINGKLLILVHGLCMNDIQWTRKEHNHGTALAEELHLTPVYLQYNSGRHVSANGKELNALLEQLVEQWPVPVEAITIVAHSMGGLLSRSALYYGTQQAKNWITLLQNIVFLGTPHQGAPLEKMGNYIDIALESIPYTKPFARLGKIRSAGITDLRYGSIVEEDWEGRDRFDFQEGAGKLVPLPAAINCYSIAAVIGKKEEASNRLGDGLVTLSSAFGNGEVAGKQLYFKKENTWVSYENNHFDLLNDPRVYARMKSWLLEPNL